MKVVATTLFAALLLSPAHAAETVRQGDVASFVTALTDLGFTCKTSAADDTSCLFSGRESGMMAVTMDRVDMFSVVFAGGALESASIAEAYRAMARRLAFGSGSLAQPFPDPDAIVAFCAEVGFVGSGDRAGCDATLVFSDDGAEIVQNVTREVMETLGMDESADSVEVSRAVEQAAIDPGVYVVLRSLDNAPRMAGVSWISTGGIPANAE